MNLQQAPKQEKFSRSLSNGPKSSLDTFLDSSPELQNLEAQVKDIEGKLAYEKNNPSTEKGLRGMLSILRAEATKKTLELQRQFANNPNAGEPLVPEQDVIPVTGQEGRDADRLDRAALRGVPEDTSVWGTFGATNGDPKKDIGQFGQEKYGVGR